MKRIIGIILLSLAIIGIVWLCMPKKANCVWCYTGSCMTSAICGPNCTCIVPNGKIWGSCWGTQ